jgi:ABC-type dipeptide/oligopeptide/nickel transport system permease component
MLGYLLRRTVLAAVTGIAVLTLVFCIVRILPGKPSHVILGDFASQSAIEALDKRLGLDRPLWVQYVEFMRKSVIAPWSTRSCACCPGRWS